ncbi:MAG: hypothetical protein HFF00_06165 [Ruminiclostridium sp.]|jgi:hypothetical protein|nr:hypothetical protein [Ruminiclostridium sp.]
MKPSTAAILRIIALAMLFFTVGSLIYALFVPQYNGLQILGFPQTYRQSYILRCCYLCVMVLLFALAFSAGSRAKRSRLNTVFSSTRYGLFVLILSIQTASLVLITPQQYHILRSIIALLCVVLTAGLLTALITMVREKTYDLCLLSECAGVLISLALYWVQVGAVTGTQHSDFRMFLLGPYLISLAVSFGLRLIYRASASAAL